MGDPLDSFAAASPPSTAPRAASIKLHESTVDQLKKVVFSSRHFIDVPLWEEPTNADVKVVDYTPPTVDVKTLDIPLEHQIEYKTDQDNWSAAAGGAAR